MAILVNVDLFDLVLDRIKQVGDSTCMNTTQTKNVLECCAYCNHEIEVADGDCANGNVPAVSDDASWEALAKEHGKDCEWVVTRAHRKFER
jgi:hypothetical protein